MGRARTAMFAALAVLNFRRYVSGQALSTGGAAAGDRIVWSASGGAEIGQHGQHPAVVVGAFWEVELAEDAVHVLFHR
jgi:hypothetical protein